MLTQGARPTLALICLAALALCLVYDRFEIFLSGRVREMPASQLHRYPLSAVRQAARRHERCENMLTNLTSGRWRLVTTGYEDVRRMDEMLLRYWKKKGIQDTPRRSDTLCGHYNYNRRPANSSWRRVGSWCDPRGERPCCTNKWQGRCSKPSKASCECPLCVDSRKYKYDKLSEWKVNDGRCKWTNYTAGQACGAIERSPYNDLYFVGDSFVRNMFLTMLMLVTGDRNTGAWSKNMTDEAKELCRAEQTYFWKECRQMTVSMADLDHFGSLCGGRAPNFKLSMKPYYKVNVFAGKFLQLVEGLIGRRGSLIILSVGFHMQCSASATINEYLGPAVKRIEDHYSSKNGTNLRRWPQIFFLLPMPTSLLKPTVYFNLQNDKKIAEYAKAMKIYCAKHRIPVFDFRQLGKYVHSFDGTHYGIGVNLLKNQILLNFIDATT